MYVNFLLAKMSIEDIVKSVVKSSSSENFNKYLANFNDNV